MVYERTVFVFTVHSSSAESTAGPQRQAIACADWRALDREEFAARERLLRASFLR